MLYIVMLNYDSDIRALQNEDGSFSGDIWGEVDTRCLVLVFDQLEFIFFLRMFLK